MFRKFNKGSTFDETTAQVLVSKYRSFHKHYRLSILIFTTDSDDNVSKIAEKSEHIKTTKCIKDKPVSNKSVAEALPPRLRTIQFLVRSNTSCLPACVGCLSRMDLHDATYITRRHLDYTTPPRFFYTNKVCGEHFVMFKFRREVLRQVLLNNH